MTKLYLKTSLGCALFISSLAVNAQVDPNVPGETIVAGKQYVLFNKAQNATQYMSRTSWDGALYFLGKDDSKYADHAITAISNEDGTWSFAQTTSATDEETGETVETTNYVAIATSCPSPSSHQRLWRQQTMWQFHQGLATSTLRPRSLHRGLLHLVMEQDSIILSLAKETTLTLLA